MKNTGEQKQTLYNLIASLLIGGINFLTAPVFTRLLGTEQYGRFSVAFSWVTILTCFMGFQSKEAIATGIYDFRDHYQRFRSSTLLLSTGISALLVLFGIVLIHPISAFTGYSAPFVSVLLLTAFGQYIWSFAQNTFIFEKQAQKNLLFSVILVLAIVLFSVLLILYAPFEKYIGRMLGFALPYTVFALAFILTTFASSPPRISRDYWQYSLSFGFPIIFHMLSTVILAQCDRVMMQRFHVPDADIGVYSWYFGLISALVMVRDALNNSWRPFYYDGLQSADHELLNRKSRNHIELFSVITCVFLLIVREVSLLMAGREYQQKIALLPILTAGAWFTFVSQFPINFELYHKKTKIIAAGTLCAALANIILNAALIPLWGAYGAAAATALSYLLLALAHLLIAFHMKGISYHLPLSSFLPGIGTISCGLLCFFLFPNGWLLRWLSAAAITTFLLWKIRKRRSIF